MSSVPLRPTVGRTEGHNGLDVYKIKSKLAFHSSYLRVFFKVELLRILVIEKKQLY